jgi:hypothetical protein
VSFRKKKSLTSRNSLPDSTIQSAQEDSLKTERPLTVTFAGLAKQRKLLQEFCSLHVPSVEPLIAQNFPVFKLYWGEDEITEFRHITSSATCFESIETCPAKFRPDEKENPRNLEALGRSFAETAIGSPLEKWQSDGAAEIYCSCRGLPYVLLKLEKWHSNIDRHLARIFYQIGKRGEPGGRFAIGEAKEAKNRKLKRANILNGRAGTNQTPTTPIGVCVFFAYFGTSFRRTTTLAKRNPRKNNSPE